MVRQVGFATWDLEGMLDITFTRYEGAAQTVAVLSIIARSSGRPGTARGEVAIDPALVGAHRSGWGVCFLEAEHIALGRYWRPVQKIG